MSMPHIGTSGTENGSRRLWSALVGGLSSVLPTAVVTNGTTVPGSTAVRLADMDLSTIAGWGMDPKNGRIAVRTATPILDVISQAFSWMDLNGVSASAIHAAVNNLAASGKGFIQDINGEHLRVHMRPIRGARWDEVLENCALLVHENKRPMIRVVMKRPDGSTYETDPAQARHATADKPCRLTLYHPLGVDDRRIYVSCRIEPDVTVDAVNLAIEAMRANGANIDLLTSPSQIDDELAWEAVFLHIGITDRYRYDEAAGALSVIIDEIGRIDPHAAMNLREAVAGSQPLPDPWSSNTPVVIDVAGCKPWKIGILLTTLCAHGATSVGTTKLLAIDPSLLNRSDRVVVGSMIDVLRTGRKRDIAVIVDLDAPGAVRDVIGSNPPIASMIGGVVAEEDIRIYLTSGGDRIDITACIASEDVAAGDQLRLGYWAKRPRTT